VQSEQKGLAASDSDDSDDDNSVDDDEDIDLSLAQWKKAISSLRFSAARGYDAIFAAELATLPDCLIDRLRHVVAKYDKGFPAWFMASRVCPISKTWDTPANSQVRPITVLSQVYRLYGILICRQILQQWGLAIPSSVTGLLPGRGAHAAAYAQQILLEFARKNHQETSGITFDIIKCYNHIRQNLAFKLLEAMKVPANVITCLQGSLNCLTRSWRVSQETFGHHSATWGYPEGDAHSVVVMVALATTWTSAIHSATGGEVKAFGYADNWGWLSSATSPQGLAMDVTLKFTKLFGLTLDTDKTWMWASSTPRANMLKVELQHHLPDKVLRRAHHERDLGVEMHYSGPHRLGHRKDRFDKGFQRLQRLQTMRVSLSLKERLLLSSVFPSMFHGSEICPPSADVVDKVRSKAADAVLGPSRTMNPAIALLLAGRQVLDPQVWLICQAIRAAKYWLLRQNEDCRSKFFKTALNSKVRLTWLKAQHQPSAFTFVKLTGILMNIDFF